MPLTKEQFLELRQQGLTVDQIVKFESGYVPPAPAPEPVDNRGFFTKAADAVSNFVGAKGIVEGIGSLGAKAMVDKDAREFVDTPSAREVAGSVVQTAANFIPGVGVGAKLATKIGAGAATGYAFDAGSKLQDTSKTYGEALTPGVGTAVGAALPFLGKITGLTTPSSSLSRTADKLEELNLRLTPVEKQNLERKGKDIVTWMSEKKIVGNPAERYSKVKALYNEMEDTIQGTLEKSGASLDKKELIALIETIPGKYADNLSEYESTIAKVQRIVKTLQTNYDDKIPASVANKIKRNEFQNAYAKNNTDVVNAISHDVGSVFQKAIETTVPTIGKLNKEYSNIIEARRILKKATTRSEVGLVGKIAGTAASTAVGGALGGLAGAAAGSVVGPAVAKNIAGTKVRSAVGASMKNLSAALEKIPTAENGNLQITRKALLNLIASLQNSQ